MTVSYTAIADNILNALRGILNDEFRYTLLEGENLPNKAAEYIMLGLDGSEVENRYYTAEERRFDVVLLYVKHADEVTREVRRQIRKKIDKITQILNNNPTNANWVLLSVDEVDYEPEVEDASISTTINLSVINYNQWS